MLAHKSALLLHDVHVSHFDKVLALHCNGAVDNLQFCTYEHPLSLHAAWYGLQCSLS
jgi:hypothetical protein